MRRVLLALIVAVFAIVPLTAKGSGHSATRSSGHPTTRSTSHRSTRGVSPKAHTASTRPASARAAKGTTTKATSKSTTTRRSAVVVARDNEGRIKRSAAARHAFETQTGYAHGRPGYVIDHIKPLACGGADAPSNMQWQTIADAKAKDRIERKGC